MSSPHSIPLWLVLVVALVASLAGGLVGASLRSPDAPAPGDSTDRTETADAGRVDRLAARVDELAGRVDELAARSVASDGAGSGTPDGGPRGASTPGRDAETAEPSDADDDASAVADAADAASVAALVEGWVGKPFGNREADALFGRLAMKKGEIEPLVAELEKALAAHPDDADLRVALATALGAKTAFATPPGPEQGVVWKRAEDQYREAIRIDPNHWQARFGLAFGTSMAPEVVGLRPKAIEQFEELVRIQERGPTAPEHAKAYLRLGTLYKDAGNAAKARAIWERGAERFPDDAQLAERIRLIGEK